LLRVLSSTMERLDLKLAEAFSGIFVSFQWFRMDLVRINAIENGCYPLQRMPVLSLAIGNLP